MLPTAAERVVSIPWVKSGEPFEANPDRLPPGAFYRANLAKLNAIKEVAKGCEGLPQELEAQVVQEARTQGSVAFVATLVHELLTAVDPRLGKLSAAQVRDRLTADEAQALLGAMFPQTPKREKQVEVRAEANPEAEPDPLGSTRPSETSLA